mmetsp:Transcript_26494/g.106073  ORF Transcript_26494/g.106073 Transcript_26494/m.106073 type:complete len:260 (-) Transcript_26494:399-1178(-)
MLFPADDDDDEDDETGSIIADGVQGGGGVAEVVFDGAAANRRARTGSIPLNTTTSQRSCLRCRLNTESGVRLPPVDVVCAKCDGVLFSRVAAFFAGPPTQSHIAFELYLDAPPASALAPLAAPTQLNCARNCHAADGLFLVAGRGDFIDTRGFRYAVACGPRLARLRMANGLYIDWLAQDSRRQRPTAHPTRGGLGGGGVFSNVRDAITAWRRSFPPQSRHHWSASSSRQVDASSEDSDEADDVGYDYFDDIGLHRRRR